MRRRFPWWRSISIAVCGVFIACGGAESTELARTVPSQAAGGKKASARGGGEAAPDAGATSSEGRADRPHMVGGEAAVLDQGSGAVDYLDVACGTERCAAVWRDGSEPSKALFRTMSPQGLGDGPHRFASTKEYLSTHALTHRPGGWAVVLGESKTLDRASLSLYLLDEGGAVAGRIALGGGYGNPVEADILVRDQHLWVAFVADKRVEIVEIDPKAQRIARRRHAPRAEGATQRAPELAAGSDRVWLVWRSWPPHQKERKPSTRVACLSSDDPPRVLPPMSKRHVTCTDGRCLLFGEVGEHVETAVIRTDGTGERYRVAPLTPSEHRGGYELQTLADPPGAWMIVEGWYDGPRMVRVGAEGRVASAATLDASPVGERVARFADDHYFTASAVPPEDWEARDFGCGPATTCTTTPGSLTVTGRFFEVR